jgi:hypothetical protein
MFSKKMQKKCFINHRLRRLFWITGGGRQKTDATLEDRKHVSNWVNSFLDTKAPRVLVFSKTRNQPRYKSTLKEVFQAMHQLPYRISRIFVFLFYLGQFLLYEPYNKPNSEIHSTPLFFPQKNAQRPAFHIGRLMLYRP